LLAELHLAAREPCRGVKSAGREREPGDDVDEVVPAQEHRGDDDVGAEEADERPGVLERDRVAVMVGEERQKHRTGRVQRGEDVLLCAARLDGVEHGVEPHAARQLVLVAIG
jgi:hypothetical protein